MNQSDPAIDLSTATTAELIGELKKRSSALVIGLDPLAARNVFTVCRHGDKLHCIGLARVLCIEAEAATQNDPRDGHDD